jgi:hypothetical protein
MPATRGKTGRALSADVPIRCRTAPWARWALREMPIAAGPLLPSAPGARPRGVVALPVAALASPRGGHRVDR